jgi:glycosyltransferase involved in cell wall biosynthesis
VVGVRHDHAVPKSHDTIVFVPAWNEAESLPAVLQELHEDLPDADVVVIDDGSTDATAAIARGAGAEVVSFGENRGLRAAIAAGYGHARDGGYAFCGRVDADGQHPVGELGRLLERVRGGHCDVAIGSRFATGDGFEAGRYAPSRIRRFGTGLLRRSMHVVLREPFHDATSGMYATNAAAARLLAEPYSTEAPEVEAILRLQRAGLAIQEVPVHMRERALGESKLKGKKAVMVVVTIAGTLLAARRMRRR